MSYLVKASKSLYYSLSGPADAPAVVFTHGAGLNHRMFDEQVAALKNDYRVLVWDIPGHGLSSPLEEEFSFINAAVDLIDILNEEQIKEAVLVGHSLGGYIAQIAAALYANRISALVMIGSTPLNRQIGSMPAGLLKLVVNLISLFPAGMLWPFFAQKTALRPEVRQYAKDSFLSVGKSRFGNVWRGVASVTSAGIPSFSFKPLLITHGEQDFFGIIRRDSLLWHRQVPGSRYAVIPAAGHNANQDNPAAFNRELRSFLVSVASEGAHALSEADR